MILFLSRVGVLISNSRYSSPINGKRLTRSKESFRIQSLGDEIIKKDNEIKELLVKHEKDIKDTVINTESMFRTKMKLDPPTNYLRILKAKDHRIYVLQATLKSFRKDFQKKLVLLRNEISRLNKETVKEEKIESSI